MRIIWPLTTVADKSCSCSVCTFHIFTFIFYYGVFGQEIYVTTMYDVYIRTMMNDQVEYEGLLSCEYVCAVDLCSKMIRTTYVYENNIGLQCACSKSLTIVTYTYTGSTGTRCIRMYVHCAQCRQTRTMADTFWIDINVILCILEIIRGKGPDSVSKH